MEDEVLIRGFIGKKYDKFINKRFFIPAFFFGGLYYIYRKMYVLGFSLYLLTIATTSFIDNVFVSLFLNILLSTCYGLFFGPSYMKFSKSKVEKIKNNHFENAEDMLNVCNKSGGTNFWGVPIAIMLYAICYNIIMPNFNTNEKQTNEYNSESEVSSETLDEAVNSASEYNGALSVKSDIKLKDSIEITIPDIFSETLFNTSYWYRYEYETDGEDFFDKCEVSLKIVNGYSDSNKLISEMAEYHSAIDTLKKDTINNVEWSSYYKTDRLGATYYSATTHGELVYLLEYSIGKDVKGNAEDYMTYYNSILNSITFID